MNALKQNALSEMCVQQAVSGGNKSSPLCVFFRMAVLGLNNQSLYIIMRPAGLVEATIMSC